MIVSQLHSNATPEWLRRQIGFITHRENVSSQYTTYIIDMNIYIFKNT